MSGRSNRRSENKRERPQWTERIAAELAEEPTEHPLDHDDVITQIGSGNTFREIPRFEACPHGIEFDVSATLGDVNVEEAVRRAFKRPARSGDSVRTFLGKYLYDASYAPTLHMRRPSDNHVGIFAPVDHRHDPEGARRWWHDPLRVTLAVVAAQ